jgi:hypothetical protein
MRNSIILVGLGVTLAAVSAARAQTVEAIVMPAAKPAVVAQAPVAVPPSGVVLPPEPIVAATAPVETFETVRTVTSTEPPRRVYRRVVRPWTIDRVTTVTRTRTVRTVTSLEPWHRVYRRVVHPRVAAGPAYGELVRGPRLYDVVTPAPAVALQSRRSRQSRQPRSSERRSRRRP